ncbi:MAG: CNNM domain-containing protein, partial [Isosphaeraceae bacterium]
MSAIVIELLVILLLIVANGLFSMSEMAVVSSRRARLLELAERGDRRAKAVIELLADPNRLLSTVQIGITLVGTIVGVFSGARVAGELANGLRLFPMLAPYAEPISLAAVVAGITFVTLVLGELVPKR